MVTVVLPSGVRVKSTPVPVSGRVWGEVGELSVRVRVPVRGPAGGGGEGDLQGAGCGDSESGAAGVGSGDDGEVAGDGVLLIASGRPPLLVSVTIGATGGEADAGVRGS